MVSFLSRINIFTIYSVLGRANHNDAGVINGVTKKRISEILVRGSDIAADYETLTTNKSIRVNHSKVCGAGTKFNLSTYRWFDLQLPSLNYLVSFVNAVLDDNYPDVHNKKFDFLQSYDRSSLVLDSFVNSEDLDLKLRTDFAPVERLTDVKRSE